MGAKVSENSVNPTEENIWKFLSLERTLENIGVFETVKESFHRRSALRYLESTTNYWINSKAKLSRECDSSHTYKVKIFTHGSYRLGVHFKDDDIDVLLVVPKWISRGAFYREFPKFLRMKSCVEYARRAQYYYTAPVIRTKLMGIKFDIIIARTKQNIVPDDFQLPERTTWLWSDMISFLCNDVVRNSLYMLNMVYSKHAYRMALKAIRLWARRRGIYSNVLGYFNGVSLAIMTCRICQLFPCASASLIVYHFFRIFSQWQWPAPVRLCFSRNLPDVNNILSLILIYLIFSRFFCVSFRL